MKKLLILCLATISYSAIFAQDHSRNVYTDNNYSRGYTPPKKQPRDNYKDQVYANNDRRYNGNNQRINERDRQTGIAQANRDYDLRVNSYRNDRSINPYERDKRIREAQWDRQQKVNSFGKGAVAGVIVGLLAGALFSR
ncbi:MAG: hypothetical protein ABIQ88_22190 [Chitinophagaceae bacterium]